MVVEMGKNELLAMLWDDETVTLEGVAGGVTSCIDRDQALNDDGGFVWFVSVSFAGWSRLLAVNLRW